MAAEAAKGIDYLYEYGKRLGEQVTQARKELNSASKALDHARQQLDAWHHEP